MDYEDGSAPDDKNNNERDTTDGRVQDAGDGILSSPVVDLINEDIILQSSDTSIISEEIDVALQKVIVQSWRERWN
jgi:hypothetical protein